MQRPFSQMLPFEHTSRQPPQFFASICSFTHSPSHAICASGHAGRLANETIPTANANPSAQTVVVEVKRYGTAS